MLYFHMKPCQYNNPLIISRYDNLIYFVVLHASNLARQLR